MEFAQLAAAFESQGHPKPQPTTSRANRFVHRGATLHAVGVTLESLLWIM